MKVEYYPDTVSDLKGAIAYYESQLEGLGDKLRQEIYRTIERFERCPNNIAPAAAPLEHAEL